MKDAYKVFWDKSNTMGNVYSLNLKEQKAYWKILDGIQRMESNVEMRLDTLIGQDAISQGRKLLEKILTYLFTDFPESELIVNTQMLAGRFHSEREGTVWIGLELGYKYDIEAAIIQLNDLRKCAEQIISEIPIVDTDDNKIKAHKVYRYMISHFDIADRESHNRYPASAHTIETMIHRKGCCEGFSKTFAYLMRILHIPVLVVIGEQDGNKHAWNKIEVSENQYDEIDVTFACCCKKGYT